MSAVHESHDSLIYIDSPPSSDALAAAHSLVTHDLDAVDQSTPHPSLPHGYAPRWSPSLAKEHDRIASGAAKEPGIDMSRYEAVDVSEAESDPVARYRDTLRKAYAQSSYLSWREINLSVLEKYGKNTWLISNSQLEDILKQLEAELADNKKKLEEEEAIRRAQQEAVAGEMLGLEDGWKKGIGKLIETELAVEGLRREILERGRAGAT